MGDVVEMISPRAGKVRQLAVLLVHERDDRYKLELANLIESIRETRVLTLQEMNRAARPFVKQVGIDGRISWATWGIIARIIRGEAESAAASVCEMQKAEARNEVSSSFIRS